MISRNEFKSSIRCPECRQILIKSTLGAASHMRKHVRHGDVAKKDALLGLIVELRQEVGPIQKATAKHDTSATF